MDFKKFALPVKNRFDELSKEATLYRVDIDRDALWDLYLKSFPEGTNPIYKERTYYDCNCCKNFIRDVGSVVAIKNGELHTIWDIETEGFFQEVSNALSAFVKEQKIKDVFQHYQAAVGNAETRQQLEGGKVKTWNHFSCTVPKKFVKDDAAHLNDVRTTVQVFERGLTEITDEAINIVNDLIAEGSLYRGDEFKNHVQEFRKLKVAFTKLKSKSKKNLFVWENYSSLGARIRNTVIGSLLQDISEGVELDKAVASFESKVAPTNYKRPTALITKGMIEQAMKTVEVLGVENSLERRHAEPEDLSVNNVLFADRSTAKVMKNSLKENLLSEVKDTKDYSKVEQIQIDDFISNVLPNITSMEVLFQNKHANNLMSIIAPKNADAPNILKWDNNFSWSYNGNVTDSIKERVKNAGGNVNGVMRVSLSWFNFDDLDLHIKEPSGFEIYFSQKRSPDSSGFLDVDMNAGVGKTREPVENVAWVDKSKIKKGVYLVFIHNFSQRETSNVGFDLQTEDNGSIRNYSYKKVVRNRDFIQALTFEWDGEKMINIQAGKDIESSSSSKDLWNIATEKFHKVNILTISPNHWDGQTIGNKHFFFILENCLNDEPVRGFYNEFLKGDFDKHRKVFEVISGKMKCEMSNKQLSGLGFSSTKRDSVICKVKGNFTRTLEILF